MWLITRVQYIRKRLRIQMKTNEVAKMPPKAPNAVVIRGKQQLNLWVDDRKLSRDVGFP